MIEWAEWLQRYYQVGSEGGKKYASARQLSMAISDGHNPNAVSEIEAKGVTTIERLREVIQATAVNPIRLLLEMEIVSEADLRDVGVPQVISEDQSHAMRVLDGLVPSFRQRWLESGEGLLSLQQELDLAPTGQSNRQ